MSIKKSDYENVLADYTNRVSVASLLKEHREYMEMIPSMRRVKDSIVTIPLPLAKIRSVRSTLNQSTNILPNQEQITSIPCDIAILMCDPEWKIKIGVEILIFIHRPEEDFSDLLKRWRQSQIYLHQPYEWIMPTNEQHMFSDIAEQILPLFIIFPQTPDRIKKGLNGTGLPYIEYINQSADNNDRILEEEESATTN